MSQQVFRFKGKIERFDHSFQYYFVRFPFSVEELFGIKGGVRMIGTMNGTPIDRGLMPDGNGGHFLIVSIAMQKKAGVRLGQDANFELRLHDAPNDIEIPEELEAAFEQEPEARTMYEKITPGMQRSIVSYITSAKTPATREKRTIFLMERFLSGYYLRGKHKP